MTLATNDRRTFLAASVALTASAALTEEAAAAPGTGGRITAHVLDLCSGAPAKGIHLELHMYDGSAYRLLKNIATNADGHPPEGPLLESKALKTGRYQAVVHVGDYFKKIAAELPRGYHSKLTIEFDVYDAQQHHHLTFQVTPWTQTASVLPG